jgi:hypothetical protein
VEQQPEHLINKRLTTPRAAAIAGILFSVLLLTSLTLIRISLPANPLDIDGISPEALKFIQLSLNIIPFAGIAFLWFIGVIRDRLGVHEDRFFATVFLGSGLLFLGLLFTSAAVAGGMIEVYINSPETVVQSGVYTFGRVTTYQILNIYAIRMAGVFVIVTSTLSLRTGITPKWMVYVGYFFALFLLLSIGYFIWASAVFPVWVLMISIYILFANYRKKNDNVVESGVDSARSS